MFTASIHLKMLKQVFILYVIVIYGRVGGVLGYYRVFEPILRNSNLVNKVIRS